MVGGGGSVDTLEVKDLVKDYGSFRAVNGISFSVKEGEIFGLIGPNGAGKTTTLQVVSTLLQVTSGSVVVDGHDVARAAGRVRKVISYLPEDAGAYKDLRGEAYLRFIASFFRDQHDEARMLERGRVIADLGDRLSDKVDTYSKGMTRRLLVARALMVEPKLAVLDEPTSGLDVLNAKEIRRIIKDYVQDGSSVVLSSHNMLEVEFMCDRIALISEGVIVETGSPADLKERYGAANIEEVFAEVVS
jgi:ABC-2 type transport system ATP-binding protein